MKNREVKNKIEAYRRKFLENKGSVKSLMWHSYAGAANRYRELILDIDFTDCSVLDVGCGFGNIVPYIYGKTASFVYTGADMVPEFITEAKKRYPDFRFIVRDYIDNPLREKFDIVLCCGALNSNYSNAVGYRKKAIKIMFDSCKRALAFNMAGGVSLRNNRTSNIHYANSLDILNYCLKLTKKVIFRHHYNDKDFTVVMFKD